MAENDERFETESLAETTTSFSQLLFGDGDGSFGRVGVDQIFGDVVKPPRMLRFGDFAPVNDKGEAVLLSETTTTTATATKSSVTCSDSSSSASSSTNNSVGSISKSNTRKRGSGGGGGGGGGPDKEMVQCTSMVTDRRLVTNASKKTKSEYPSATVPIKRKEKLGERIAALQQLVSPFGKSDTASVLHEAMGYIKFLQEQVQVLCSPYLQRFSNSIVASEKEEIEYNCAEIRKDLRSQGLCLVPIECTKQLVNDNGADLWSPSMAGAIQ